MWWQVAAGVFAGLVVVWLGLVVALYAFGRRLDDRATLTQALRLMPDVIRLIRRLAADETLPRGVRFRLLLLIAYLVSPIDLIPDFIPVIGYADDAVIVAVALRSVSRAAGPDALDEHWPGTPEGLRVLKRLARLD